MDHHPTTSAAVGAYVRDRLQAEGLDLREVEAQTGIARTTLHRRLRDGGQFSLTELDAIAALLGGDVVELINAARQAS